jgi:hypothetical protein
MMVVVLMVVVVVVVVVMMMILMIGVQIGPARERGGPTGERSALCTFQRRRFVGRLGGQERQAQGPAVCHRPGHREDHPQARPGRAA